MKKKTAKTQTEKIGKEFPKEDLQDLMTGRGYEPDGYEYIKGDIIAQGAKYAKSVYVAFYEGKELKIGNIKMTGACLSAWIEFSKENKVGAGTLTVKDASKQKKGATTYFVPNFTMADATDDENDIAMKLDGELQTWVNARGSKKEEVAEVKSEEAPVEIGDSKDLPF